MARDMIYAHESGQGDVFLFSEIGHAQLEQALRAAKVWQAQSRLRSRFLKETLLSDTAWDLLVELFIQVGQFECQGLLELSKVLNAPITTIERWAKALERSGLICLIEGDLEDSSITARVCERGLQVLTRFFCSEEFNSQDRRETIRAIQ